MDLLFRKNLITYSNNYFQWTARIYGHFCLASLFSNHGKFEHCKVNITQDFVNVEILDPTWKITVKKFSENLNIYEMLTFCDQ